MGAVVYHTVDIILNLIGALTVFGFIYVFVGFQKKTLWAKQYSLFGYKLNLESTSGKQLKVEITK